MVEHDFEKGDYAEDKQEPTPSPEANTVKILELTHKRADEHLVKETGKTVSEHKNNQYYPDDDPVVIGHYPHMNGNNDKTFAFPESRLRKI